MEPDPWPVWVKVYAFKTRGLAGRSVTHGPAASPGACWTCSISGRPLTSEVRTCSSTRTPGGLCALADSSMAQGIQPPLSIERSQAPCSRGSEGGRGAGRCQPEDRGGSQRTGAEAARCCEGRQNNAETQRCTPEAQPLPVLNRQSHIILTSGVPVHE